jgi:hypothetical protein
MSLTAPRASTKGLPFQLSVLLFRLAFIFYGLLHLLLFCPQVQAALGRLCYVFGQNSQKSMS